MQRPLLSFGPKASMQLRTSPVNVCKVVWELYDYPCFHISFVKPYFLFHSSMQELRSSSQLISEFVSETSTLTTDGHFSTAWLKNLQKPMGSLVLSHENCSESNQNAFQFCTQPSSIPGSVLQLVGSSYLLRATAWEMYGR